MKKIVLIIVILVAGVFYGSIEKKQTINIENNSIFIKYPSWTVSRLSGTNTVKYMSLHSNDSILEYYQNLNDYFTEKGYIKEEKKGYLFFKDFSTSDYYYVPEVKYIEYKFVIGTQYNIENIFIDVFEQNEFK
jgi:hypothetical protein